MCQDERRGTEEGEETAQKSRMKTRGRHFLYIFDWEKQKDVSRLEVSERMRKEGEMGGEGSVVGKYRETNQSLPDSQSDICRAEDRKDSCKLSESQGVPEIPSDKAACLCVH